MKLRLCFTGSQQGMTSYQFGEVHRYLERSRQALTHIMHGGCVGADTIFHERCVVHGLLDRIEVWPSDLPKKQGLLVAPPPVTYEPRPPLVRNRLMVDRASIVLATPKDMQEVQRSGTWATIRYAWNCGLPVHIIWPQPKDNF